MLTQVEEQKTQWSLLLTEIQKGEFLANIISLRPNKVEIIDTNCLSMGTTYGSDILLIINWNRDCYSVLTGKVKPIVKHRGKELHGKLYSSNSNQIIEFSILGKPMNDLFCFDFEIDIFKGKESNYQSDQMIN